MTFEAVDAIGEGRVWTGEIAQKIGLVDVLGDLKDAIHCIRNGRPRKL
jgi:protease-4